MSEKIKLSKETLVTLNKAAMINPGLKVKPNENSITTTTTPPAVIMTAPIAESLPREFNVYDLKMFLKTLSLVDEPVLDFSDPHSVMIYSGDGATKTCFRDATPDLIKNYVPPESIPDLDNEKVVDCIIPAAIFDHVMKASRSLGHNYVGLISDGTHLTFSAFNLLDSGEKTDIFSVNITECAQIFSVIFKLELTDLTTFMNEGDLQFKVSKRGVGLIVAQSGKRFLAVFDGKSEFTED